MPELAEVEFFRKRWDLALGQKIQKVLLRPNSRLLREVDTTLLSKSLTRAVYKSSHASAKQMLFQFSGDVWLGIHLGMTGELKLTYAEYTPTKHDHLVLFTREHTLVFSDPRMFGRIQYSVGKVAPLWWSSIAPAIVSPQFTVAVVQAFLTRRKGAPIKAVLLMQERFPGIGNWMADEILWRAEIHPRRLAGSLDPTEVKALHRECRWVAREALRIIGTKYGDLPKSWLFSHRWENGGVCPKTGVPLKREEIGGRTTCWSPGRQKIGASSKSAAKPRVKKFLLNPGSGAAKWDVT